MLTALAIMLTASCADPGNTNFRKHQARRLSHDLQTLSPSVQTEEADKLATTAVEQSARLSDAYQPVRLPWFNNFLINRGLRDRGLCYQWRNDLFPHLFRLRTSSLKLHLATSRKGTMREHNSIVVTAAGQPFESGLVLDPWRGSGKLWWGSVKNDTRYPWVPLSRDQTPLSLRPLLMPQHHPIPATQ